MHTLSQIGEFIGLAIIACGVLIAIGTISWIGWHWFSAWRTHR